MRAAHFSHVLTHLGRTRDSRYDGLTNAAQIASAFAGCLQGVSPYVFIAESLLHHTANFRPAMVDDYLGRVGIEHGTRRAIASAPFADYIDRSGYIVPQDRPEAVLDLIVDLVSRRNEVAHGDISNTLAPSALIPYCDQVEAYARGLVEVFEESLLAHLVQYHGVDHGSPIAVYNHDIVCIPSNGVPFSAGSILAIKRVDGPWYSAKVTNVQIDRVEVDSAPMGRNVDVALRIDGRCKDTYLVRSGVYDVLQMPSETVQQVDGEEVESPTRGARLDSFGPSDVEIWRQRRDEAQLWLERNGGGSQGSWLMSEFERCCDGLLQAETRLLDGETDD